MTTKIAQLIDSLVDEEASLMVSLRLAKVIAARLKAKTLASWVDDEIHGYATNSDLPAYRILRADLIGTFRPKDDDQESSTGERESLGGASPSASDSMYKYLNRSILNDLRRLDGQPSEIQRDILQIMRSLPRSGPALLPLEQIQELVAIYRSWSTIHERRSLREISRLTHGRLSTGSVLDDKVSMMDATLTVFKLQPRSGFHLDSVALEMGSDHMRAILEQVRSRLLDLMLELEGLDPEAGESVEPGISAATVINLTTNHIFGNGNAISVLSPESDQHVSRQEPEP